jgi:hypothetical protein
MARVNAKTEAKLAAEMASDDAWEGVSPDWVSQAALRLARYAVQKKPAAMRFDADDVEF